MTKHANLPFFSISDENIFLKLALMVMMISVVVSVMGNIPDMPLPSTPPSTSDFSIDDTFCEGSIQSWSKTGINVYTLKVKRDPLGEKRWEWFYFRVSNLPIGEKLTFKLDYTEYEGRGWFSYWKPLASYTNVAVTSYDSWFRIHEASYSNYILKFSYTFTESTVYICCSYPFPNDQYVNWLNTISSSEYATVTHFGDGTQGRAMYVLTITNLTEPTANKKTIWNTAGQHTDETHNQIPLKEMCAWLLTDNATARLLRNKFVWKNVIMADPDSNTNGRCRMNTKGYNLNRCWDGSPSATEINNILDLIDDWNDTYGFDLFCDWHTDGRSYAYFYKLSSQGSEATNFCYNFTAHTSVTNGHIYNGGAEGYSFYEIGRLYPDALAHLSENMQSDTSVTPAFLKAEGIGFALAVRDYFGVS